MENKSQFSLTEFESMVNWVRTLDRYQPLPLTKAEIKHFISSVIHTR